MSLAKPLDNITHHIERINAASRINLVYGDLRDYLSIHEAVKLSKPDYVFHLAAQSYPKTSFDSPLDTLETNVQGTANVLEALRKTVSMQSLMFVHPRKYLGASQEKNYQLMKSVTFIQPLLMLYLK